MSRQWNPREESYLKWSSKTVVEHLKNVQNQGLQCVSRYKTMVSSKNTTLVETPCLYQYDTPLEQMVLIDQVVNLIKCKFIRIKYRQKSQVALILEPICVRHSHKVITVHLIVLTTDIQKGMTQAAHIHIVYTFSLVEQENIPVQGNKVYTIHQLD